jgi:hypothetical protein
MGLLSLTVAVGMMFVLVTLSPIRRVHFVWFVAATMSVYYVNDTNYETENSLEIFASFGIGVCEDFYPFFYAYILYIYCIFIHVY